MPDVVRFWCAECGRRFMMDMAEATKRMMMVAEAEKLAFCPDCLKKRARNDRKMAMKVKRGGRR